MNTINIMKYFKYFAYLAILSSWITILISIHYNPWFNLARNPLSDLGGGNLLYGHPSPKYPFIYNFGMIMTGSFMILFGTYIIYISKNKIENSGGTIFSISGLFLILIGISDLLPALKGEFPEVLRVTPLLWVLIYYPPSRYCGRNRLPLLMF